jgi:short subunit dehydrogenase-like uncharacterized protein
MKAKNQRPYDVVVWGATGFTGRLVAEHLLETYGAGGELRWAIAGRDRGKLEATRDSLGEGARTLPLILANAEDDESLDALAGQTRVVCTTVGPYAQHGSKLIAACVRRGTDSCDLTGEPLWMRRMIDQHHEAAQRSGARIVNACGFDSIPSDCGVAFLNAFAVEKTGHPCTRIALRVEDMQGAVSGGTVASTFDMLAELKSSPTAAQVFQDPYSLNPAGERSGPDGPDLIRAAFDADLDAWVAPFVMENPNSRIVRRTNALLGYPYGRDFRYGEATLTGAGAAGRLKAYATTMGFAAFFGAATLAPRLVRAFLPSPGEGPSREQRETGSFAFLLVGHAVDGAVLKARVTGDRDPGYGATSRMLAESAVCLAKDLTSETRSGILTPAAAMQKELLPRLTGNAGLTFEVLPG